MGSIILFAYVEILRDYIMLKEKCPRCTKNAIIADHESGEVFCSKCGFVISEKLQDSGPEWRTFLDDKNGNKARTGIPMTLASHDMGLSTVIGTTNKDVTGKQVSSQMKMTLIRLRKLDTRSQFSKSVDKNYRQAFTELLTIKEKLSLSDAVIEKAAYIYRKAVSKGLVKGRSISALLASSLYVACRDTETPRTLNDFVDVMNIKKREIAVCYRMLLTELDLRVPVVDSVQCIARVASKAGISEKTKRYAIEILRKTKKSMVLAGKNPMGLAASALYIACMDFNEGHSQKEIAQAANVTEVTIRNRCKGLKKALNL